MFVDAVLQDDVEDDPEFANLPLDEHKEFEVFNEKLEDKEFKYKVVSAFTDLVWEGKRRMCTFVLNAIDEYWQ